MLEKKSILLLFSLIITPLMLVGSEPSEQEESESEIVRKKGCEQFCCINVTGNETIGGDLTVGGTLTVNGQTNANALITPNDIMLNGQSVAALFNFGSFYFDTEPTRATPVTITPGQAIPFPTTGPGTSVVRGSGNTEFLIVDTGSYTIRWSLSFSSVTGTQPTQIAIFVNNTQITKSLTQNSQTSGQISNSLLKNIPANAIIELKNIGTTTFTLTGGSISMQYNNNNQVTQTHAS